ncbi:hypothetical protein MMC17_007139 [Xylographa soralifera]|nr:hypothetical protein [Xylographa soralifera]
MPQIPLYPPSRERSSHPPNPLPRLLQTPSGLAILELQGTINMPASSATLPSESTTVGRLVFPDYNSSSPSEDKDWHKKVYLYVGKHQRLTGEVKKLPKPLAVVRRRTKEQGHERKEQEDELEVVEIVSWKVVFSNRPEPVGETEE